MVWNESFFDRSVLITLIALEALLFCTFFSREVGWYPPLAFDQTTYLTSTYSLEERILSKGLSQLGEALWSSGQPTGVALPIEGAVAGPLLGGARLPQLSILFLAFAAL